MSGVYFYEVMFSGGKTTRGLVLTPYERREAASAWIEKQTDGIVVNLYSLPAGVAQVYRWGRSVTRATPSSKDVAGMMRDVAVMVSSGIPLLEAFRTLAEDDSPEANKAVTALSRLMLEDLSAGATVTEAFARQSAIFPESVRSLVAIGDASGTMSDPATGPDAGRSYVVFGKANTTAIDLATVAAGTGGFVINGQATDNRSGLSVASAGDVNGDGLADLIVGAYGVNSFSGRSYVVFGKADTTAINLSAVAAGTGGFVINAQAVGDWSGSSVSSAGDVNGDGLADLIVGAYAVNGAAGRSYVVFGKANTTAIDLSAVAAGTGGFVINGQAPNDFSGQSVASAGDVNGDGLADLLVSAYGADPASGLDAGRSYVVFGKSDTTAINLSAVASGTGGFVINGQVTADLSGNSVASAGDVNGDGLVDLIVGARNSDPAAGADAGRTYVVFGKSNTTAVELSAVAAGTGGFVINGQAAGDYSGTSVSSAGDVNGDGLADLIVGAFNSDPAAGANAGRTYVVYGKAGTTAVDLSAVAAGNGGFVINGQTAGDQSGVSVASAGDVDGDGVSDLIVGAGYSDPAAGADAGRSYVILSSQIGQGNFGAELTQMGTSGVDTLTGTSGANRIAAGAGNDTITGAGGADVIYGGAGNDTIVLNASNIANVIAAQSTSRIDGGTGRDTVLMASDVTGVLDLRGLNGQALKGIEMLDFDNGAANTLQFNNINLRSLHDEAGEASGVENRVMVGGEASDAVQLYTSGAGTWSTAGTQVDSGTTYNVYAHSSNSFDRLWIEQGMAVAVM